MILVDLLEIISQYGLDAVNVFNLKCLRKLIMNLRLFKRS